MTEERDYRPIIIFALLAVFVAGLFIKLKIDFKHIEMQNQQYQILLEFRQEKIKTLSDENKKQTEQLKEKDTKIASLQERSNFYDSNIVFIVSTRKGSKYHTYDCHHMQNSDEFWAYNTEAAEAAGHEACKVCH